MKIKYLLLTLSLLFILCGVQAQQTLKIGHVNIQELVQKHPAMDSIKVLLQKEQTEMEEVYNEMLEEHEARIQKFENESDSYSDFVKKTKQEEILEQAQKIQNYNQSAQQQLQQRNMELIQPIYQQINQEITNIAGQNHFTYVLDVSTGSVAYISPESEDITPLVLERIKAK